MKSSGSLAHKSQYPSNGQIEFSESFFVQNGFNGSKDWTHFVQMSFHNQLQKTRSYGKFAYILDDVQSKCILFVLDKVKRLWNKANDGTEKLSLKTFCWNQVFWFVRDEIDTSVLYEKKFKLDLSENIEDVVEKELPVLEPHLDCLLDELMSLLHLLPKLECHTLTEQLSGKTLKEIGEDLGVSEACVCLWAKRARSNLKRLHKEHF